MTWLCSNVSIGTQGYAIIVGHRPYMELTSPRPCRSSCQNTCVTSLLFSPQPISDKISLKLLRVTNGPFPPRSPAFRVGVCGAVQGRAGKKADCERKNPDERRSLDRVKKPAGPRDASRSRTTSRTLEYDGAKRKQSTEVGRTMRCTLNCDTRGLSRGVRCS